MKKVLALLIAAIGCVCIFSAHAGNWTFDNNTITDGSWVLNVNGNVVGGAITVTGPASGSGELDLRDMTVDGVAVTALTIGTSAFASNANITKFYANNVTGALTRTFAFSANLTHIEISGDGITGLMPVSDGFAESCTGLTSVKINAPNMTEIGNWAFLRCRNLEADIADIVSPSVRRFGVKCLCGGGTSGDDPKNIYGKLTINYLEKLEGGALNRTKIGEVEIRDSSADVSTAPGDKNFGALDSCAALTNVTICLRKGDGVGNWFFCDCSGLKKVAFKGNVQYVFGGENFARKAALTTVSFEGPAPSTASLDLLLGSVEASSPSKNCTIYASKKQNGWLELADELSDDESAVAPSGCFGVYRNGSRKAWLVNQSSPYDPVESGAVIVQCSPSGVGSPVPEVGQHENVEPGTTFMIPQYYVLGNDLYRSTGFTLEEYVDDAWTTVSNGTSRTWTYQTSDKMQRLTWVHELCGGTLTITKPADSTVNVSPAPVFENAYLNGAPIVITAVDMTDPVSVFHHWSGDVPAGCEATSRTLDYAFNGAQSLTANYDCRDWKGYAESSKYYITDHNWLFEASFDDSIGLLRITNCKGGAGVLDWRNMSVNGTKVKALKIEGGSGCFSSYVVTHFYADNLAADLIGTFYGQKSLLTVEMSGDGVTALVPHGNNGVFDECKALVDVRYDFPNLRKIGTFSFFDCKELTNDIATLIPRTVTNIGHRAFLSANKVRGCLTLDRCDYIGHGAFRDSGVEDVRLGDGALIRFYDHIDPVEPLDKVAGTFQGASKLTNLVVNAKHFAYFGTNTVRGCTTLKTITFGSQEVIGIAPSETPPALTSVNFKGPAVTMESLDNLLAGVTAKDGKKDCVVRTSQTYSDGWQALASPLVDGDEKTNAPKGCYGVYRADSRKAYMKIGGNLGFVVIVR